LGPIASQPVAPPPPAPDPPRPRPWTSAGGRVAVAAAFALLVAVLFPDALFRGRVFYARDVHLLWYAQAQTFVRCLAAGSWPVWNPYPAFGQPLLAVPYNQVAYPFTWLNLILPPGPYYTAFVIVHVLIGAAGTHAFARQLPLSRAAAAAAAVLWSASGPVLCLVNAWNLLAGIAYLPWIFLAGDRAVRLRRGRDAFLWGVSLAAPLLAASPDAAALGGLGSVVHALRHLGRERSAPDARAAPMEGGRGPRFGRAIAVTAMAVVFAIGLAAVQWLPALEVAQRSARGQLGPGERTYWSLHPAGLLDAILPFFLHQWPLSPGQRAALFESREPFLASTYLGLAALGLVVASFAAADRWSWRLMALIGLVAGLAALGRHTPVFEALVWAIPPLRALRYPVKAMTLVAFCWAVLAGFGVEAWREGLPGRLRRALVAVMAVGALVAGAAAVVIRLRADEWGPRLLSRPGTVSLTDLLRPAAERLGVAAAGTAVVAMLALLAWRGRHARAGALAAVVVAAGEVVWAHRALNPTAPASFYAYRAPVATAILGEPHGRVYTYDYFIAGAARKHLGRDTGFVFAYPEKWPYPWAGALALRTYAYPQVIAAWGLESAFERDAYALYSPHAMQLAVRLREVEGTPAHRRLLRLGGVTHVVSLHTSGLEDLRPLATFESPFPEPIRVFGVPEPLPRTYAVGAARVVEGMAALDAIVDDGFDPRRQVVLASGLAREPPPDFEGQSRIVSRRPDRLELEARLSADGYVVLLEGYDAGWSAMVDGRPAPVLRANVAFRAVAVPAGRHRLEFRHRPRTLAWGAWMTLATLIAGAVLVRGGRGKRASET
jgi:hypothetical protein